MQVNLAMKDMKLLLLWRHRSNQSITINTFALILVESLGPLNKATLDQALRHFFPRLLKRHVLKAKDLS